MRKLTPLAIVVFPAFALLLVFGPAGASDKIPTVKEIMRKLHKGPDCLRAVIARQLKADSPEWAELEREGKEFSKLAESLGKNEPPKGAKESWEKLTKTFAERAEAMHTAIDRHDKKAANAAHQQMGNCKSCHDVHK